MIIAVEEISLRSDDHAAVSVQPDFTFKVIISVIGHAALEPQCVGLHVAHHEVYVKMAETTRPYSAHGTHANHAEGVHPIGRWRYVGNGIKGIGGAAGVLKIEQFAGQDVALLRQHDKRSGGFVVLIATPSV